MFILCSTASRLYVGQRHESKQALQIRLLLKYLQNYDTSFCQLYKIWRAISAHKNMQVFVHMHSHTGMLSLRLIFAKAGNGRRHPLCIIVPSSFEGSYGLFSQGSDE